MGGENRCDIVIKNVSKFYGRVLALDNISFSVREGEIFCLLGPNGAGKSTLMKLIMGILYMDSGEIYIKNREIREDIDKIKSYIGYLSDETGIYEEISSYRFLYFFSRLYNLPSPDSIIEEYGELLNIDKAILEQPLNRLSFGQRKKIMLLKSLLHNPSVLLLDEPTAGLDPISRKRVLDIIQNLNKEGKTIFVSTHNLNDVERIAHSLAIINRRILLYGEFDEIKKEFSGGKSIEIITDVEIPGMSEKYGAELYKIVLSGKLGELIDILSKINKKNGDIISINTEEPSLEDIFIKKTLK